MSSERRNPFVDDIWVSVHAELQGADGSYPGPHFAIGERPHLYDAPARYSALRPIRCKYPSCVHEIAARCSTCKRLYCAEHCNSTVPWSRDSYYECDLCAQHLPRDSLDSLDSDRNHDTLVGIGAITLFLMIVSVGIAVDISARAGGFIVAWVFAIALFILSPHMEPRQV